MIYLSICIFINSNGSESIISKDQIVKIRDSAIVTDLFIFTIFSLCTFCVIFGFCEMVEYINQLHSLLLFGCSGFSSTKHWSKFENLCFVSLNHKYIELGSRVVLSIILTSKFINYWLLNRIIKVLYITLILFISYLYFFYIDLQSSVRACLDP